MVWNEILAELLVLLHQDLDSLLLNLANLTYSSVVFSCTYPGTWFDSIPISYKYFSTVLDVSTFLSMQSILSIHGLYDEALFFHGLLTGSSLSIDFVVWSFPLAMKIKIRISFFRAMLKYVFYSLISWRSTNNLQIKIFFGMINAVEPPSVFQVLS